VRGKLITFEGIDGCGKTKQLGLLADYLSSRQIPYLATREPGGTPLGRKVRSAILDSEPGTVEPLAELLLYAADRAQHVRGIIQPALADGYLILSDRFYDATTAYQGYGRGFDLELVKRLNMLAAEGLKPTLTLLFDLEVKIALARVAGRGNTPAGRGKTPQRGSGAPDRLDREPAEFHERVRRGYLEIAAGDPDRFRIIPAHGSPEEIHQVVIEIISAELRRSAEC
jgi:dTMP kinase